MFKEASFASIFDLIGLFAGYMIALQLGVFEQLPLWAIALYPAVLSARGVINGLLSGRLITALHLGSIYPKFFGNTKSFKKLIEAMVVLTLATAGTISVISLFFGSLLWGLTIADFSAILTVIVATMSLSLLITLATVKLAFISFKRSLDPETTVYPAVSIVANIIITFFYIAVLNLYFFGAWGRGAIILFGLVNVSLVLAILPRSIRQTEFTGALKESLGTMLLVSFLVNITGTFLLAVNSLAFEQATIFTAYPAMIDIMGDAGLIVGATATTKLALGVLNPSFSSIKSHAKNIFSIWAASFLLFIVLGFLSLIINRALSLEGIARLLPVFAISNVIAFVAISIISYWISILTFKRGLDPDNFVIPVGSALADSFMTMALFAALLLTI
ncbi:MAG: magnesium transporter [Candidatus Bathyarchaeota archaeon]|nr:magnesium transporter [Candidatus Bathyarchaeota archaeon]